MSSSSFMPSFGHGCPASGVCFRSAFRLSGFALLLALATASLPLTVLAAEPPVPAATVEAAGPQKVVQGFYDVLLEVMKQADKLGYKGRYATLDPALTAAFDLDAMTRMAVGPEWPMLSEDLHQQLADRFHRYTVATYASRFDGFGGEHFEVGAVKETPRTGGRGPDTVVETKLVQGNGDPVVLNYLMRQKDGQWRIVDVYLIGSISQLASQRSEFGAILRATGGPGLVKMLDEKIATMGKSK